MTDNLESSSSISERIQFQLQSLPRAERQVALAILANYPASALTPVASIAREANVSGPTVLRFVKSLGYSSFPDFKEALRNEIAAASKGPLGRQRPHPLRPISRDHWGLRDEVQRVYDAALANVDSLPHGEWEAMLDLLADTSRNVYITGGRFSISVARDLALNLQLMRPKVQLLDDVDFRDQSTLLDMNRRSIFVVYDFMRYQKSIIRAVHAARENGASVILFTDGEFSPIRSIAQILIPVSTEGFSTFSGMAIPTLLTEIALGQIYDRLGPSAAEQLSRREIMRSTEVINE